MCMTTPSITDTNTFLSLRPEARWAFSAGLTLIRAIGRIFILPTRPIFSDRLLHLEPKGKRDEMPERKENKISGVGAYRDSVGNGRLRYRKVGLCEPR